MRIREAREKDLPALLELARQVEPLFGPMVEEPGFVPGLSGAVRSGDVLCADSRSEGGTLAGAVIIAPEPNEVAWLAVAHSARGRGAGRSLLEKALERLDSRRPVRVVTFAPGVLEGEAARRLYVGCGFRDAGDQGRNPAGFPVVLMQRPVTVP